MNTGLTMNQCTHCGHTHFPPRAVCPRCWGEDFTRRRCTTAQIDETTTVGNGPVRLATLRTDAGPLVVGQLGPNQDGGSVALSELPDVSGTAFVPAGFSPPPDVLPRHSSTLRGLDQAQRSIPKLLQHQAERYGDKPLFVCGDSTWSYRETVQQAGLAASGMRERGIGFGDRVAIWCRNRPELLEAVLGCAWLGAIAVPLNTALRGPGLRHTLNDSGAKAALVDPDLLSALTAIDLPETLQEIWLLDTTTASQEGQSGAATETILTAPRGTEETPPADVGPHDTAAILYTSGTTGLPKGVCCPHAQFYWWGVTVGECLSIDDDDVLYNCLPMFHTNALNAFFQAIVAGATFVLGPRFSASRFWTELLTSRATVTYLLGAMAEILRARSTSEYEPRHRVRVALAPATPLHSHHAFRERFGIQLVEGYGSTETNMVIGADASMQRPGKMGITLPDFETRVVDERGIDVPSNVPGELLCRSRQPFAFATRYFNNPADTAEAWTDGWFHTGDRVILDDNGWFTFVDRTKDSIRRRGENISSLEVEQALAAHPAVQAAAVFAVPSELAEDEVMATLVAQPGNHIEPSDVIRHCESQLSYFAIPRYIDIVDTLPLTENGKVQKSVLRKQGIGTQTWDRDTNGSLHR